MHYASRHNAILRWPGVERVRASDSRIPFACFAMDPCIHRATIPACACLTHLKPPRGILTRHCVHVQSEKPFPRRSFYDYVKLYRTSSLPPLPTLPTLPLKDRRRERLSELATFRCAENVYIYSTGRSPACSRISRSDYIVSGSFDGCSAEYFKSIHFM